MRRSDDAADRRTGSESEKPRAQILGRHFQAAPAHADDGVVSVCETAGKEDCRPTARPPA